MSQTTVKVQLQQRYDTAANWTSANPTLLAGEIGWESDTKKYKIGDSSTQWTSLAYAPGAGGYTAGTGVTISTSNVISTSAIALSTIQTAANETAMLALTTQEGDVVVRSDQSKTYMKNNGTAGSMGDFTELATPTDAVTSVNGATGAITGLADLSGATFTGDVVFTGDAANVTWDKSTDDLIFNDNAKAIFGTDSDGLEIFHDSSDSFIKDSGTGSLKVYTNDFHVASADGSQDIIKATESAGVELYESGDKKAQTYSDGLEVLGDFWINNQTNSGNDVWFDESANTFKFSTNVKATFGTGNSIEIYHNGSDSYITNSTGGLNLVSADDQPIQLVGGVNMATTMATFNDNGSVELFHASEKVLNTGTDGVVLTGTSTDVRCYFYTSDDVSRGRIEANSSNQIKLVNSAGNTVLTLDGTSGTFAGAVSDDKGDVRKIIKNAQTGASSYAFTAADVGKCISRSGGNVHFPANDGSVLVPGDAITIINNSSSDLIIDSGTNSWTMYNTADAATGNRTLAARGMATIYVESNAVAYISGAGLS